MVVKSAHEATRLDSWSSYLDGLARLGTQLELDPNLADAGPAEALQYLAGMSLLHHDRFRGTDPRYPVFVRSGVTPGRDWGNSNADTFYLAAAVDGRRSYRIRGQLGDIAQTIISSYYDGMAGAHAGLHAHELVVDADGSVEIAVGPERPAGAANWLPTTDNVITVGIYQVRADWETERRGWFTIECDEGVGVAMPTPSEAEMAERLAGIGGDAADLAEFWRQVLVFMRGHDDLHEFTVPAEIQVAMRGAKFTRATWDIPAGMALVVESEPPADASYWGWASYTHFGAHLDFANRQTCLNHTQASVDADGKVRLVLCAEDPGVWNWIDIAEHPLGRLSWRVTTPSEVPAPTATLVPLAEVSSLLPDSSRRCSATERRDVIAARQRSVARWYAE